MVPQSHDDRRVGRKLRHVMQVRLTDEQAAAVEARAEAHGIAGSEALRQLLEMGMAMAAGDERGWAISDAVQEMIARREPLVLAIAPDPKPGGPMWFVTPEEIEAYHREHGE